MRIIAEACRGALKSAHQRDANSLTEIYFDTEWKLRVNASSWRKLVPPVDSRARGFEAQRATVQEEDDASVSPVSLSM